MGTGSGSGTTVEVDGGVGAIGAGQVVNRLRSLGFARDDIGGPGKHVGGYRIGGRREEGL